MAHIALLWCLVGYRPAATSIDETHEATPHSITNRRVNGRAGNSASHASPFLRPLLFAPSTTSSGFVRDRVVPSPSDSRPRLLLPLVEIPLEAR